MDKKIDWAKIVSVFERMIEENNPETTTKNSELAALSSVLYLGSLVICTSILLNNSE